MRFRLVSFCLLALLVVGLSSCNLPRPSSAANSGRQEAATAAAETVQALGTQLVGGTVPAPVSAVTVTVISTPTAGTAQPSAQASQAATAAAPASSPTTAASAATPSTAPVPCDRAKFDAETIPDGTSMSAGQTFTKTWTLKNDGSCTWDADYSVVFISGDAMSGPAAQPLTTGPVAPGQSVQISMQLQAPAHDGTFRGVYKLRNGTGAIFGLGPNADQTFWVEVKVSPTPTPVH